eukprot:m.92969 g.92969  ORF g.92969 m.92969 type:complete len:282 (-) comp26589_c0_seq1:74-919(-)
MAQQYIQHPFRVESTDHCETPNQAYSDIAPILEKLALLMGKTKETLKVYDPYFCAGGVKKHLNDLGFPNVYNECQDFYKIIETKSYPEFDVLLTNPPYSTKPFDHIERLMHFCQEQRKPYLILQPCYVYVKDYYKAHCIPLGDSPPVGEFYVTPSERYMYRTPTGLRDVKAGALSTSPFVTFWFCGAWAYRDDLVKWWCEDGKSESTQCRLRLTTNKLPRKFKDSNDPSRPRLRKKQREALKRRQTKASGAVSKRGATKKPPRKGARKFNRGDAPHRKRGP